MKESARNNLSIAEDIIKKSLQKGCDAAEVYIIGADSISVEAKEGTVDALEVSRDFGIAVKVIKKHRLGFSFTSLPERAEETINAAMEASEHTCVDKFMDIPDERPPSDVKVFDSELNDIKEEDVIRNALALEKRALSSDEMVKKVRKAEVSVRRGTTAIANSRGVNISYQSGYISASVTLLAVDDKGDSQMGWDFDIRRKLKDLDIAMIGASAAERAIGLLGSRTIIPVRVPVILDPHVSVQFLDILSASLSADAVQKKRSFLTGKVGRKIISDRIDIIDDGVMPWGIGTRPVDDEGVPTSDRSLITEGVLAEYIHNTYTAAKAGTSSTGNASRGGFKSLPGVAVTNLYIKQTGNGRETELIKSMHKGILITDVMGIHTANPVSGDFSIGISGIWIEGGERKYPVKEALMSGNILDLFIKVEETGRDLRFYGNTGSPSLLVGEMDISA